MSNIEKQIADRIAKANGLTLTKIGLRFDKVVVRLCSDLRDSVESMIPNEKTVVVTITAPIKVPAKTANELELLIKDLLELGIQGDRQSLIFENEVHVRVMDSPSTQISRFIALVHNPSTKPQWLLDLVALLLLKN